MAEDKSCFVIMPITTPDSYLDKYRDGEEHFHHVLETLFVPSIEKAGYTPVPPIAKGADIIPAKIIKNLETNDLVLCDMSCLNPNVFFEYGIRTALNKPVCVVKDEMTEKVPFDVGTINYKEYQSSLNAWDLGKEIDDLSEHIAESAKRSGGENTLWKYFGLKSTAAPFRGEGGEEDQIEYIKMQIDSIKNAIGGPINRERSSPAPSWLHQKKESSTMRVSQGGLSYERLSALEEGIYRRHECIKSIDFVNPGIVEVTIEKGVGESEMNEIIKYLAVRGIGEVSFKISR